MHQVAKLVEEDDDLAVLHQSRIAGLAAGEVAHQHSLRKLPATNAGNDGSAGKPFVLAVARVHVEIDAAEQLALVALSGIEDIEGVDGGIPNDGIFYRFEVNMKKPRGGLENSRLHLVVREVGTDRLGIEVVFGAAVLLATSSWRRTG